jgi:hypothetical protein
MLKKARMILQAALIFGLVLTGCDIGTGGGEAVTAVTVVTYSGTAESGKTYTLTITENSNRAAYTPQPGDAYVLVITIDTTSQRSTGTVKSASGSSTVLLSLQPSAGSGSTPAAFTVTITVSGGSGSITEITEIITLENGETVEPEPIQSGGEDDDEDDSDDAEEEDDGDDTTALTTIDDIKAYLDGTAADPVPLPVSLTLPSGWADLLSAIAEAGKFVALDLSSCTMTGKEFNPGEANTGERWIVSLVLPNEATSIQHNYKPTFKNFTALTSVSGDKVETVGKYAFNKCDSLETVSLPEATKIGESAFSGCTSLHTIDLPEATTIDQAAFSGCTSLKEVSLSAATYIGYNAFSKCEILTEVSIPEAKEISSYAFWDCTSLQTIELPLATKIYNEVFRGCTSLDTVSFPVATYIGRDAFYGCTALQTVNLPVSLTTIERNPFTGCVNLTAISVDPGNTNFKVQDGMLLLNNAGNTLIAYPSASGSVTLDAITTVGGMAFGCTSLEEVSLPAATKIDSLAFYRCTSLKMLNLPATPPTLGYNVFSYTEGNGTLTIRVPSVAAYTNTETGWGVKAETGAWGDTPRYGDYHKAITITAP